MFLPLSFFCPKVHVKFEQAELIDLTTDNYMFAEVSAPTPGVPVITPNLLSIDELLETVCSFSQVIVHLLSLCLFNWLRT